MQQLFETFREFVNENTINEAIAKADACSVQIVINKDNDEFGVGYNENESESQKLFKTAIKKLFKTTVSETKRFVNNNTIEYAIDDVKAFRANFKRLTTTKVPGRKDWNIITKSVYKNNMYDLTDDPKSYFIFMQHNDRDLVVQYLFWYSPSDNTLNNFTDIKAFYSHFGYNYK